MVSSQSKFRVKGLPNPTCQIAGKTGSVSLPKGAIGKQTVVALFEDFDFDLPLRVLGYTLSAPGLPAIEVSGNKFNNDARGLINRVRSGGKLTIENIKGRANSNPKLAIKSVRPIIITVI